MGTRCHHKLLKIHRMLQVEKYLDSDQGSLSTETNTKTEVTVSFITKK